MDIDKLPARSFRSISSLEGYKRIEDENGHSVVVKKSDVPEEIPTIDLEDLPF